MVRPPAGAVWGILDDEDDPDCEAGVRFGFAIVLQEWQRRRRRPRRHGEEEEQVRKEKALPVTCSLLNTRRSGHCSRDSDPSRDSSSPL